MRRTRSPGWPTTSSSWTAGRAVAQGPLAETLARVDLPITLGEDAGAVFEATVVARDAEWHLARVVFDGGELRVRDNGTPLGRRVRVRVLARDVSIANSRHDDVSILNLLPATSWRTPPRPIPRSCWCNCASAQPCCSRA
jgi:ABC-type molybdate transport system ATPase subunit